MGISDYLTSGKEAVINAGSLVKDGFVGGNAGGVSRVTTTVGVLAFTKGAYDTIRKTGEMVGMVDPGVDETGKKKEAASLVSVGTSALITAVGAYLTFKGGSMGRGA